MTTQKRSHEAVDPDYEDSESVDQQTKRQRALEKDAKESVSKKIQSIVKTEFEKEINMKETELQNIDSRLNEALLLMDKLRACIVATYYSQGSHAGSSQTSTLEAPPPSIHPAVKKYLGKAPKGVSIQRTDNNLQTSSESKSHERLGEQSAGDARKENEGGGMNTKSRKVIPQVQRQDISNVGSPGPLVFEERHARFKMKKKVIVGNVSKYIPVDNREANDMSSHKWMVYVRGPRDDPDISGFVCKVWFFLHHSYKPNDLVEVSSPPFHLTRRGWGEFPVRVQLHFTDPRNKKVDIIHHLKLDKTFTGLQTLGAETVVHVEIEKESNQGAQDLSVSAIGIDPVLPVMSDTPSTLSSKTESKLKQEVVLGQSASLTNLISSEKCEENSNFLEGKVTAIKEEEGEENISSSISSYEYHMTIAHEQTDEKVKEEEDVDVCEESMIKEVKLESATHVSHSSSQSITSHDSLFSDVTKNPLVSIQPLPSSSSLTPLLTPSLSQAPVPIKLDTSVSSGTCASSSTHSLAKSSAGSVHQQLTVIKDPTKLLVSSAVPLSSPMTLLNSHKTVPLIVASALNTKNSVAAAITTSCPVCVANTYSVVVSSQNSGCSVTSAIIKPSIVANLKSNPSNTGTILATIPSTSVQNKTATIVRHPKMVILKPNQPLPKVVHLVNTSKSAGHISPVLSTVPSSSTSSGIAATIKTQTNLGQSLTAKPLHQSIRAHTPVPLTKTRQVSLLTGQVVERQMSPQSSGSARGTPLVAFRNTTPQSVLHVAAANKQVPATASHIITASKPLPTSHTVIKVMNKKPQVIQNSLQHSTIPVQILGGSAISQESILHADEIGHQVITSANISQDISRNLDDINYGGSSTPQLMLSLPGGATIPLLPDTPQEKMSAVGITKHGKGYRSVMAPTGSRRIISEEERLRGQFEVLRAFKENPEMYQKKPTKRIVLASSDAIEGEEDVLPKLQPNDYVIMRGLLKAAVLLHPLIQADVNKITHPYCAESLEQWNSWPVGKQRASEWHRACFTLKYLRTCLNGSEFRGQQLMSTCQLMIWCRQHAFSPVSPIAKNVGKLEDEQDLGCASGESYYQLQQKARLQSFTQMGDLSTEFLNHPKAGLSEEVSVDIMNCEAGEKNPPNNLTSKKDRSSPNDETIKPDKEDDVKFDYLPPSEGALFVYDELRKRGIRLEPHVVSIDSVALTSAEMLFKAMQEFCSDLVRETLSVSDKAPRELTCRDVHSALTKLPEAAFCCNKFLGKQEDDEAEITNVSR